MHRIAVGSGAATLLLFIFAGVAFGGTVQPSPPP